MASSHTCTAECVTDPSCPRFSGGKWHPYIKITSPRAPIPRSSSEPIVHPISKRQIFITGPAVKMEVSEDYGNKTLSLTPPLAGVGTDFQIETRLKLNDTVRLPSPGNYIVNYQISYHLQFDPKITPGTSFRVIFQLIDTENTIIEESIHQGHTPFDEDYPDYIGKISSLVVVSSTTPRYGLSLRLANFDFRIVARRFVTLSTQMVIERI